MPSTKQIILKLKEVKEERNLSYEQIMEMCHENGDFLSKSSVARVFQDGSENRSFNYQTTIRPIAKALLDMETIEESDTPEEQAMKIILKAKMDKILELEEQNRILKEQLADDKVKHHEKLEKERGTFYRSIEFLKHQIELKDKRIDILMDSLTKQMEKCENCRFYKTNEV